MINTARAQVPENLLPAAIACVHRRSVRLNKWRPFYSSSTPLPNRLPPLWSPSSVQDLHREYSNIFRHGNRNAACDLWSSFLFERAEHLSPETFETMCSGYCAVSRLADAAERLHSIPSYAAAGSRRRPRPAGLCTTAAGRACAIRRTLFASTRATSPSPAASCASTTGPSSATRARTSRRCTGPLCSLYGRGETTLAREAPEVRCDAEGRLIGATLSDHGYPIISMFFDAEVVDERTSAADADASTAVTPSSAAAGPPRPGRISHHATSGVAFQDEYEYSQMCAERAANGYNSGMGEIFRKVAGIAPVILRSARPAAVADTDERR